MCLTEEDSPQALQFRETREELRRLATFMTNKNTSASETTVLVVSGIQERPIDLDHTISTIIDFFMYASAQPMDKCSHMFPAHFIIPCRVSGADTGVSS